MVDITSLKEAAGMADVEVSRMRSTSNPDVKVSYNTNEEMKEEATEPTLLDCMERIATFCQSHLAGNSGVIMCDTCELHTYVKDRVSCTLQLNSPVVWDQLADMVRQNAKYEK